MGKGKPSVREVPWANVEFDLGAKTRTALGVAHEYNQSLTGILRTDDGGEENTRRRRIAYMAVF